MELSVIGKESEIQSYNQFVKFEGKQMVRQKIEISQNENCTQAHAAPSKKYVSIEEWLEKEPNIRINQFISAFPLGLNVLKDKNKDVVTGYLQKMSLKQLKQQKSRVKDHLRVYDTEFMAQFGRFPQKCEKRPIQTIYIYYKMVKEQQSLITDCQTAEKKQIKEKRAALKVGFKASHGRKIEHKRDIKPIYDVYKEYKELKKYL